MNSFRNNHKKNRFRSNGDRNFKKRNGDLGKFSSDFSTNTNFLRKFPGRNNHNASKLIEKYNELAKEAISNGDKILSENYLQHADHFARILQSRDLAKEINTDSSNTEKTTFDNSNIKENNTEKTSASE